MLRFINKLFFIFPYFVFLCFGCDCSFKEVLIQSIKPSPELTINDNLLVDEENNLIFSQLNKKESNKLNYSYTLSSESKGKESCIVFSGLARSNYAYLNAANAVPVQNDLYEL